ncbi:MAG: tetratricopeptide repeat protein [Acidobacteria bacterium]|nr:tetratricopeptide repeat protein [Acidobacteriota bacterium]
MMLVMELAGHQCADVGTLDAAVDHLTKDHTCTLVLTDATIGEANAEDIRRVLKAASPHVNVITLTEELLPGEALVSTEVITAATSPLHKLPTSYSPASRGDAVLILLPEQDSLRMIPELPRTAGMLNKLAVLYHSQEKYDAAEKLYKQALQKSENSSSDKRREMASILHNLANLYRDQKRYMDAEQLYLKSISLVEKLLGKNHPKVWNRLNCLADVYRAQGREADVKSLLMRFS